ncbi:MAG: oprO 1 [Gemmataceae bacterium]|nr:oprO 1 [Gemmataceae bacterium]
MRLDNLGKLMAGVFACLMLHHPNLSAQYPPGPPGSPALPDPLAPAGVNRLSAVASGSPVAMTAGEAADPAAKADPNAALKAVVLDVLKELEAKKKDEEEKKKKEAQAKGHEIGSNLNMNVYWDNGLFFATPDRDWRIHVGGRFQFESVWWNQNPRLTGTPPGNGGVPASGPGAGVGALDDGMFFRRVRFRTDGVGYENYEYVLEVDFEQLNFVTFDHMWFGAKDDTLGSIRIGQHKVPQGMEMMGSDYHLTFLERSSLSDAFWTLFAPGVFYANDFFNKNVTFQTMFHKIQPLNFYTGQFGSGQYAETSRLTWTPLYDKEGAEVVHVGGSYQWRQANLGRLVQPGGTGSAFGDTQNVVTFRARPELRDATGIGAVNFLGDNSSRWVSTGFLIANHVQTISPEFLAILGPFSVQAEAAFSYVNGAKTIFPGDGSTVGTAHGNPMFWGSYIEASYFLTGEHRGYDRRFGTYDRPTVGENAFVLRGEDGRFHLGTGAWQVAYRYSFLDLNNNAINGGQLLQHTIGLNWYLNDNAKLQFQYSNISRNVIAPANSGTVNGFGLLAQWYF